MVVHRCNAPDCPGHSAASHECAVHRCSAPGCPGHSSKSHKCAVHRCSASGCPGHSSKSHKCAVHRCSAPGCPGHSSKSHKCAVHRCSAPGCPGHSSKSHKCAVHRCSASGCPGHSSKSHKCAVHRCSAPGCPGHSSKSHKCAVHRCSAPGCPGHSSKSHACPDPSEEEADAAEDDAPPPSPGEGSLPGCPASCPGPHEPADGKGGCTKPDVQAPNCKTCALDQVTPVAQQGKLLPELDRAGRVAAQAVATYVDCSFRQEKRAWEDLDDVEREEAANLYMAALRRDGGLDDPAWQMVDRWMRKPEYRFDAVIYHSGPSQPGDPTPRRGLARLLLQYESEKKLRAEKGKYSLAKPGPYSLMAYLDEKGRTAAEKAWKEFVKRAPSRLRQEDPALEGPPAPVTGDDLEGANEAAFGTLVKTLAGEIGHDLWEELNVRVPPAAVWGFIALSAAGGLASFILAPKMVTEACPPLAKELAIPLAHEFRLAPDRGGGAIDPVLKLEVVGKLHILPEYLSEGHLFEQNLRAFRVGGEAKVTLGGLAGSSYTFSIDDSGAWSVMWNLDVVKWIQTMQK